MSNSSNDTFEGIGGEEMITLKDKIIKRIEKLENKENKTDVQRGWNMAISEIILEIKKIK